MVELRLLSHPDSIGGEFGFGPEETTSKAMFPGLIHILIGGVVAVISFTVASRSKSQPVPVEDADTTQ